MGSVDSGWVLDLKRVLPSVVKHQEDKRINCFQQLIFLQAIVQHSFMQPSYDCRWEREAQHQKEHEKSLKADNERLQTLIEFKSQDCQRLQERCQSLEERLRELNVHGSSISSSQGSPRKSPRKRRVAPGPSKAPEQRGFPSHQSFLSAVDVSGSRSRNFENAGKHLGLFI